MNRRGFLSALLKAGAAFTILPPATTYNRLWRATPSIIVPAWEPCSLTRASFTRLTADHFECRTDVETAKCFLRLVNHYYREDIRLQTFPLSRVASNPS